MITLALETSTTRGSVAVLENENVFLFREEFPAERTCSSHLFANLQRALASASRVDQIVVGLGPGSFSGVRIAISAAIGLSLGTGAKLVGIPSVAALDAKEYFAIGDARRGAWYFTHVQNGIAREGPLLLDRAALDARLAAQNTPPIFTSEETDISSATLAFPSAEKLARLADADIGITARDDLEPIYLRDPHITLPRAR